MQGLKDLLDAGEAAFDTNVTAAAQIGAVSHLHPFCRQHNLAFRSGNGVYTFVGKSLGVLYPLHVDDWEGVSAPEGWKTVKDFLDIGVPLYERPLYDWVDDYTPEGMECGEA